LRRKDKGSEVNVKQLTSRLAFWLAIVLFSAMLGLVPSGAEAHSGHQANPGITADVARQASAPGVPALTDSADRAEVVLSARDLLPELAAPVSAPTDRSCNGSCCNGVGCCPFALPLAETLADRFSAGSDRMAGIAGPGPDAVLEVLPEPPRSFV
jgi:hypothetical protein